MKKRTAIGIGIAATMIAGTGIYVWKQKKKAKKEKEELLSFLNDVSFYEEFVGNSVVYLHDVVGRNRNGEWTLQTYSKDGEGKDHLQRILSEKEILYFAKYLQEELLTATPCDAQSEYAEQENRTYSRFRYQGKIYEIDDMINWVDCN